MNHDIELFTITNFAQFVSHWAHDLRSPFNHILGFTKIVLNGQDGPLTDLQKEDLSTAYHSSLRAMTLVNNLIDIARIIEQQKEINLADVRVAQIVEPALHQWKKANPTRELQIENAIESNATLVRADEAQLRQAIIALIAYLAEFVEAPVALSLRAENEPDWCLITLQTKGKKAHHPSAFDLEMYGFIGRSLIELQHGKIRQWGETDDGAVLTIAMPLAQAD